MKKNLLTVACATLLFAACNKDDENTPTTNISKLNEAEYFVGNFMNIDSTGNLINRFVGKPTESDTTIVVIRVKDVDEADAMAYSFLPDSAEIKGDKTSWQYDLKDTLNKTQATLQYAHESGTYFAGISVSGDCSKYVSRIQFIDANSDNAESKEYHFGDTKTVTIQNYGTAIFTCLNNSAPYYFVHVSPTKYSMEAHDKMHYAQMPYAANLATLQNLSNAVAQAMIEKIKAPTHMLFPLTNQFFRIWSDEETQEVYRQYANILGEYEPKTTFSISSPLAIIDGILYQYIDYEYESPEYWTMYNNHDYPYSSIKVALRTYEIKGMSLEEAKKATPKYECVGSTDEDYHWSYASPCSGHQFIFVMVEN